MISSRSSILPACSVRISSVLEAVGCLQACSPQLHQRSSPFLQRCLLFLHKRFLDELPRPSRQQPWVHQRRCVCRSRHANGTRESWRTCTWRIASITCNSSNTRRLAIMCSGPSPQQSRRQPSIPSQASNSFQTEGAKAQVLKTVKQNGLALQFASDGLRKELKDRAIVLQTVKQDRFALQFASDELRNDRAGSCQATWICITIRQ